MTPAQSLERLPSTRGALKNDSWYDEPAPRAVGGMETPESRISAEQLPSLYQKGRHTASRDSRRKGHELLGIQPHGDDCAGLQRIPEDLHSRSAYAVKDERVVPPPPNSIDESIPHGHLHMRNGRKPLSSKTPPRFLQGVPVTGELLHPPRERSAWSVSRARTLPRSPRPAYSPSHCDAAGGERMDKVGSSFLRSVTYPLRLHNFRGASDAQICQGATSELESLLASLHLDGMPNPCGEVSKKQMKHWQRDISASCGVSFLSPTASTTVSPGLEAQGHASAVPCVGQACVPTESQ
jgi:hypothetical protein